MTDATGNAVSTDALRRIRRLCRDPQDEDLCLVSDAADRSTGPGIERVVKDSRLITRRPRWIVWLKFFRHALLSEDDRAPGCRSEGSDRRAEVGVCHRGYRAIRVHYSRIRVGLFLLDEPSMTQGIDFFLLRKRLHKEFGSWSARAAHSRGARDGAAGSYVQPQREQSSDPQSCPQLDAGLEGHGNSRERSFARSHRDLVVKERSYRLGLRQRRPAQGRCRIGVTADTGRPAPNFSATRPTPNLNLAVGAKLLSLGQKTCAIAGNGVGFKIMAGRRLLRRNITESDVGVSYASHQGAAARACWVPLAEVRSVSAGLEKHDDREVKFRNRA